MEKVIEHWRREGINLLPPSDESYVIATLNKTGRNISRDVLELYCATGGMKDSEMDSLLLSLWPLAEVQSENSNYQRPYLLFADHLINSHFYCLRYEREEVSSVYVDYFNGDEPQRVADTLSEFFDLCLTAPERIEMPDLNSKRI